jgi:hypothetical protein
MIPVIWIGLVHIAEWNEERVGRPRAAGPRDDRRWGRR